MIAKVRPLDWVAILALLLILGAVLFPLTACGCKVASPATACLSNLKQLGLGHVMYAYDNDDRFARRDYWADAILPYVKNKETFHDPELPKGSYGYAFNAALDGAKTPPGADKVPLVYDSLNPIRNASDPFTSLPTGGRHPIKEPRWSNVAYADGHAKPPVDEEIAMRQVAEWIVGVLCVLVIAAILFPVFAQTRGGHHHRFCLSSVKQLSVAQMIYLSDTDDRFPHRDVWVDATYPYAKSWTTFHCPQAVGTAWGYAFNGALDRARAMKLEDPAATPMLYDSVNPIKNASDLVTSLPAMPRHGQNYMGYADGHAKAVATP